MTVASTTEVPVADRVATTAMFFANGLGIGAWSAAIPGLSRLHGLGPSGLSLVLLCFAAGAVAAMPLAGLSGGRVRTSTMTWGAGLAFAASLLVPGLAPTLPLLCVAAVAMGMSNGIMDVSMNAHGSEVERRWPGPVMSSFHAAFSLGGLAGALLGAALAHAGHDVLPVAAVTIGAAVLGAARFLNGWEGRGREAGLALPSKALLALSLIAFICMMLEGAVADWSGTLLSEAAVPAWQVSAGYAAFSCCMVVGRLCGDRVVGRVGRTRVIVVGAAMAGLGLLTVGLAPGLATGLFGFGLIGLGLSNVVPAVFSAASQVGPAASAGIAMAATAGYGGFLLGPVLVGGVATLVGLRTGMLTLAAAAGLIAVLAWAGRR